MPDLLKVRESFHKFIDPMWQSGLYQRASLYEEMTKLLGREAHVAEMSLEELEKCSKMFVKKLEKMFPCYSCINCVGTRHFLPVCLKDVKRDIPLCNYYEKGKE